MNAKPSLLVHTHLCSTTTLNIHFTLSLHNSLHSNTHRYLYSLYLTIGAFAGVGDEVFYANSPAETIILGLYLMLNIAIQAYILGEARKLCVYVCVCVHVVGVCACVCEGSAVSSY